MQGIQIIVGLVSSVLGIATFFYMGVLGLWFIGAPPFHKPTVDGSIPTVAVPIPTAVCPKCGYKSTEFIAFAKRLQKEEMNGEA